MFYLQIWAQDLKKYEVFFDKSDFEFLSDDADLTHIIPNKLNYTLSSEIVLVRCAWISHFNNAELVINVPIGEFIPTDMYYACLDGNWNADGDMTFGEANWNRNNDGSFIESGQTLMMLIGVLRFLLDEFPYKTHLN